MIYIIHAAGVYLLIVLAAHSTDVQRLNQPEQFYSDGKKTNGWTRQDDGRRTTFWFAKYVESDWDYRQELVSIYDAEPHYAYYQDIATRLFIGRLNLETGKYSLLPPDARRQRLSEIPDTAFPSPGELPSIESLLRRAGDGDGSQSRLLLAPPTAEYPRFNFSKWDTSYQAPAVVGRVKARLAFNNATGTYTLEDGQVGTLSGVTYLDQGEQGFLIVGTWSMAGLTGEFRFVLPRNNVNQFSGQWYFQDELVSRIWDGDRVE